jgi:hypothetical protein
MTRSLAALFAARLLGVALARPASAQDEPKPDKPAAPAKVAVGVYVDRITDMSLRENHFHVDFYVWFRWSGGDKDFDPLKTFDVVNGSIASRTGEVRQELKEGHYASCRVDAEVTQFFDVSRFPLDDHDLRIEIEDQEKEAEYLVYVPDATSGAAAEVQVPGWELGKSTGAVEPHRYSTNYGNTDLPPGEGSTYSQFALTVPLRRVGFSYFAKLFFGLFIAVGIALLALHIKPTDLDPRFGLPVGSIFAAVGSLYVTSQLLPDTGVIALSDRLHILAFGVIFITLIESTVALRFWASDEERSKRLDRRAFWGLAGFYVLASAIAVLVS